jgi:mycofactocin precursor
MFGQLSEERMSHPTPNAIVEQEPVPAPTPAPAPQGERDEQPEALVEDEVLVEDVSIDGMCGVY